MSGQRIAPLLRQWRRDGRFSQEQLAVRAGITRSTLSRWERGEHSPSVSELDAVLTALRLAPALVAEAFRCIGAPRGFRRLSQRPLVPIDTDAAAPPVGGDLLRAMRLRRGQTQELVASAVGVTRTTLARWETSQTWPTTTDLHKLCWHLGAQAAEVTALTVGRFTPATVLEDPDGGGGAPASVEDLGMRIGRLRSGCSPTSHGALEDLFFIVHLSALWRLGGPDHPAVRPHLAYVHALYAQTLMDSGRLAESEPHAYRALQLRVPGHNLNLLTRITAELALAERDVYGDGLPIEVRRNQTLSPLVATEGVTRAFHFSRGIRRLRSLTDSPLPVAFETWVLAHLARYCAGADRGEDAVRFAKRAHDVIASDDEPRPTELRARRQLWARILIRSGRADEAADLIPDSRLDGGFPLTDAYARAEAQVRVEATLIRVEALTLTGRHEAAREALQQSRDMIRRNDWLHLLPHTDSLGAHL